MYLRLRGDQPFISGFHAEDSDASSQRRDLRNQSIRPGYGFVNRGEDGEITFRTIIGDMPFLCSDDLGRPGLFPSIGKESPANIPDISKLDLLACRHQLQVDEDGSENRPSVPWRVALSPDR